MTRINLSYTSKSSPKQCRQGEGTLEAEEEEVEAVEAPTDFVENSPTWNDNFFIAHLSPPSPLVAQKIICKFYIKIVNQKTKASNKAKRKSPIHIASTLRKPHKVQEQPNSIITYVGKCEGLCRSVMQIISKFHFLFFQI